MEILIRLAGVQLGPYSEQQVRQHLEEGLVLLTDSARQTGTKEEDWAPLGEVLAKLPPLTDTAPVPKPESQPKPEIEPGGVPDPVPARGKRAPATPPGVTHLPQKQVESGKTSLSSLLNSMARSTGLLGPTAPRVAATKGQPGSSVQTTSPLAPAKQSTKKVSRGTISDSQKTAPLPTKLIPAPSKSAPVDSTPPEAEPKKGVLPSLIRALTAKTVPLRAPPAVPQGAPMSRATIPVTEPLPTRMINKPASGKVSPPPSEADAPDHKLEQMVMPDLEPSTPTPPGLSGDTEKIPPPTSPRSKNAKPPDLPAPVTAVPSVEAEGPFDEGASSSPFKHLWTGLIGASAVLALLMFYYIWSPYHAASSLHYALDQGNAERLDAAINFPSVRASLKEQVQDQLAQSGLPGGATGPASSTVLSMLDQSIDLYVTPEGISGLVHKSGMSSTENPAAVSPDVAAKVLAALMSQLVKGEGLSSYDDFVLDWDVAMLHLQGLGWKLNRIDLRPDLRLPGPAGSSAPLISPVVDSYLEWGNAKSKQGDWKGAVADFSEVLAIDPQSSAGYNERGGARQAGGDLDGSISDYTRAVTLDPQFAAAYAGRGQARTAKGDLDGAIADYTQALQIDPSMAAAYDGRGNAKSARNDLDGAVADYTRAISLDPGQERFYTDRGLARQANGNLDGAIADFTKALSIEPKSASAYYNRGLARLTQGSPDAAIPDFDQAVALDPKMTDAFYNRGNAKNATHDLDGALADYTQALTLNPKMAMAYCNRALVRQTKGDLDGAQADFTQALAIDPKITIAYFNRALIEEQKGDLDDAIADTTQVLYLDSKNAQAYYYRGLAKLAKGNPDGAGADLKLFYDLAPKDPAADRTRLYLWLTVQGQNLKADADQELSDALEQSWNSPADDPVSKTAAFLLGRIDETDYLAVAASPDIKTLQALQCETWFFAAMKRLLMGDKVTAAAYLQKCLATDQKDLPEYMLAQAALQTLQSAPPAIPTAAPAAIPAVPATPAKTP